MLSDDYQKLKLLNVYSYIYKLKLLTPSMNCPQTFGRSQDYFSHN